MPTIIEGPTGRRFQFESDIPEARAFELAKQQYPEFFPEEVKAPAPAPTSRTFGEAAVDIGAGFTKGIGSLVQLPSQVSGLVSGDMEAGTVGKFGKSIEEYGESLKSPYLRAQEAQQQKLTQEAYEKSGILGEAGQAIKGTITNPALLTSFLSEQIPNFIGSLGAGAVAKIGVQTVARLSTGIIKDVASTSAKAGVSAALATNAVMQGTDVGAETYQSVYDRLKIVSPEMLDDERKDIALSKGRAAGSAAAAISLGLTQLPGAKTIEKAFLGKTAGDIEKQAGKGILRRTAEGFGGEALSEGLEEGPGGQLLTNVALQQVDPSQRLGQGVGAATGLGAIAGGIFGGLSGAVSTNKPPPPPLDTQFQILADDYQKKGLNATTAYTTAARDIEKYAQPGETLTVYDSLGREIEVTVAGKNDAGRAIVNVNGEEFVLGNEYTVSDPKDGRYGVKKGDEFVASSELNKDEVTSASEDIRTIIEKLNTEFEQTKVKIPEHYAAERRGTALDAANAALEVAEKKAQEEEAEQKAQAALDAAQTSAAAPAPAAAAPAPAAPAPAAAAPAPAPAAPAAAAPAPAAPAEQAAAQTMSAEQQAAIDFIAAVDLGGIPLNPSKANAVARGLGLEVNTKSKPDETIQRIRDAVGRITPTEQTADLQAAIDAASAAGQRATNEQEDSVEFDEDAINEEVPTASLPANLSGASPRYNSNLKSVTPTFESDVDKAAYIVSGKGKSKQHQAYVDWLSQNAGFTEQQSIDHGKKVRESIKSNFNSAEDGKLNIPSVEFSSQSGASAKQSRAPRTKKGTPAVQNTLRQLLTEMRKARNKEYYDKALPRVATLVKKRLGQLGLGKHITEDFIKLLQAGREESGQYLERVISLAIAGKSDKQIMSVLDHEAIHAMRKIGMITENEWKNLTNLAEKRGWINTFLIDERYEGKLNPTTAELKNSGLSLEEWIQEAKYEEAIADAFSTYANGRSTILGYDGNDQPVYRYKKDLKLAGQPVGIISRILKILGIVKDVVSEDVEFKRFSEAPREADADKLKAETASPKLSVTKADLGREKTGQLYEVYNRKTGKVVGGPYQSRSTARSGADRNDDKYGGYAHDVREVEQKASPKFSVAAKLTAKEKTEPVWYSALSRQIDKLPQKEMTAAEWKALLINPEETKSRGVRGPDNKVIPGKFITSKIEASSKLPGVKMKEIEDTEILEWLDAAGTSFEVDDYIEVLNKKYGVKTSEPGRTYPGWENSDLTADELRTLKSAQSGGRRNTKISKDEVQQFLADGGSKIEFQDRVLGKPPSITKDSLIEKEHDAGVALFEKIRGEDGGSIDVVGRKEKVFDDELYYLLEDGKITSEQLPAKYRPLAKAWLAAKKENAEFVETKEEPTQFNAYQLPGGKNYREAFVTVPPKISKMSFSEWKASGMVGEFSTEGVVREGGRWVDGHGAYSGIDNPVVRIRFNDRTDVDGNKVLFLEELQPPNNPEFQKMPKTLQDRWLAIGLKRMIRYAAENGYAKVAWTTGEQQVERYESALRTKVDSIEWEKTPEGVQIVGYKGKISSADARTDAQFVERINDFDKQIDELRNRMQDWRNVTGLEREQIRSLQEERSLVRDEWASFSYQRPTKVADTRYAENDLTEAIGKVMADRIRNDPSQTGVIEGDNLTVDSVGVKKLYDVGVPALANKILKEMGGGKVGELELPKPNQIAEKIKVDVYPGEPLGRYTLVNRDGMRVTEEIYPSYDSADAARKVRQQSEDDLLKPNKQPSFDITPALSERAMQGMPRFSVAPKISRNIVQNNEGYWIYKGELPESFYRWFGKSVVTDKDGYPRVMFHGTARDITEFKQKQANAIFITDDEAFAGDFSAMSFDWMRSHIDQFVTPERQEELAAKAKKIRAADKSKIEYEEFQRLLIDELPSGKNIMPLFVRAEKPFDYSDKTHLAAVRKELEKNSDFSKQEIDLVLDTVKRGAWAAIERDEVQAAIRAAGFDGFYAKEAGRVNLAVYDANQIKSVTGNSGEYSRESKDIRKSVAPKLKKTSDVGHKRELASGRYVGAPDWVGNSPQQLAVLRTKLRRLAMEGEAGRYWYENSSKAIMAMAGGDKVEAERIVSLIALYSPNATVPANTSMALTAYYQWKSGVPIKAGFGDANRKAESLLKNGTVWDGIKTNAFYQNLMEEIDPSKNSEENATMDMWMAIAFDYGQKSLDQGPKYKFSRREIQSLANKLGWKPHQVQAAIWVAIKSRIDPIRNELRSEEKLRGWVRYKVKPIKEEKQKTIENNIASSLFNINPYAGLEANSDQGKSLFEFAEDIKPQHKFDHFKLAHKMGLEYTPKEEDIIAGKYDFSNALSQRSIQMSYETTPGNNTGLLPGIIKAPVKEQMEYLVVMEDALTGKDGKDLIAELAGLPKGIKVYGYSAWEGNIGAGGQMFLPVPLIGVGNKRVIKPEAKKLLDIAAALRGYLFKQKAVVYHVPIYDSSEANSNGADIKTKRALTEDEMLLLYSRLNEKFNTLEIAPGYTQNGARVLNFVEGLDNKTYISGIQEIAVSLPSDFGGGIEEIVRYRSEGAYIFNDWEKDTNGENYLEIIRQGRPDILQRLAVLQSRVDTVNKEFSKKYEWGNAKISSGEKLSIAPRLEGQEKQSVAPKFSTTRTVGATKRPYTPEQLKYFSETGRTIEIPTLKERIQALFENFSSNLAQGIADQFDPLKKLDPMAYLLARMSKGTSGALESLLKYGKLKIRGGLLYDADRSGGFLEKVVMPMKGEFEDFLWWVAANRAGTLFGVGKENLFSPENIIAGKALQNGTLTFSYKLSNGTTTTNRAEMFKDSLVKYNAFNSNVLDMAEQSGLVDTNTRSVWEQAMYVPFFRVSEDQKGFIGEGIKQGLVRQAAFKTLKGGTNKLNSDLMSNVLQNWYHLIDASAKNRASNRALDVAVATGAAVTASESTIRSMGKSLDMRSGVVWDMRNGRKQYYLVGDQAVVEALTALEPANIPGPMMKGLHAFKYYLTLGVTISPYYKVRNLIRDSVQSVAVSDLSYNVFKNLEEGYAATDRKSQDYVTMLASGATMRFGTSMEGDESGRVRALVKSGVKDSTILDSPGKVKAFFDQLRPFTEMYSDIGSRGEEINRAALYKRVLAKLTSQGMSSDDAHAQAAFLARDLMDFSMQGSWGTIRFLTQVVPFMNSRIQGLYKLGRAAKQDKARMAIVIGAASVLGLTLMAMFKDDDDWKKRTDADRNNYWWFKFGGIAYRIPKPFEVGAISTVAERGWELFFDNEMTGKRFSKNIEMLLLDNLAMNPIPQVFKPLLDVYSNKDGHSGIPIETMGMEKLLPEFRFTSETTAPAKALSTLAMGTLSPVQIDYMIKGYFGWLGTFVVGGADMAVNLVTSGPAKPSIDIISKISNGMVRTLPEKQSRYVNQIYEQAKELEQVYGTQQYLLQKRKLEEYREFTEENKEKLRQYRLIEPIKKMESALNKRIRQIEDSTTKDSDTKRDEINALQQRRDQLARRLSARFQ